MLKNKKLPDVYYRIHAKGCQLEPFWGCLDRQFEASSSPLQIRHLQIAGLSIRFECRSPLLLHYRMQFFASGRMTSPLAYRPTVLYRGY